MCSVFVVRSCIHGASVLYSDIHVAVFHFDVANIVAMRVFILK